MGRIANSEDIAPTEPADSSPSWAPPKLREFLKDMSKERPWLLDKFLPRSAYVLVSGQQKRGLKTYMALASAVAVAGGKGIGSIPAPKEPELVLFVVQEGTRFGLQKRWKVLIKTANAPKDTMDRVYMSHMDRIYLDKDDWRKRLVDFATDVKPGLIVLDPLARLRSGDSDENSVRDSQRIMETIDGLRATGACVLLLAHLDKTRGRDPKADIDDQVRGSGHLTASYDLHLALRRYTKEDTGIDLTIRDREADDRHQRVIWQFKQRGDDTTSAQPLILPKSFVREIPVDTFAQTLNGEGRYTRTFLKKMWGLSSEKTSEVLGALVDEELIEKNGDSYLKC